MTLKFVKVSESDIPQRTHSDSQAALFFRAFMDETEEGDVVEIPIEGEVNKSGNPVKPETVRSALGNYAGRLRLPVIVTMSGGRVFIKHTDQASADAARAAAAAKRAGRKATEVEVEAEATL